MGEISDSAIHHNGEGLLIWSGRAKVGVPLAPSPILTRRESEVMSWLCEGKTGPEIAIILGCATRTVEKHLANLYQKLGVSNSTAVILKAYHPIS